MMFVKFYSVILGFFIVVLSTVFTFFSSENTPIIQSCEDVKITDTYKKDSIRSAYKVDSLIRVYNYKCNTLIKQQDTIKRQQAELLTIAKSQ